MELHCHGGVELSPRGIKAGACLRRAPRKGGRIHHARIHKRQNFAFRSGEGLADMINGESTAEVRAGSLLYSGRLTKAATEIQGELTDILAKIGADVDYPEEDIERTELFDIKDKLAALRARVQTLADSYDGGKKIKNGVSVAICGRPNAGKSSLLNALLGYDKAIVSAQAGTTRDVVEGELELGGVRFNFYDTAGIREEAGEVESIGISPRKADPFLGRPCAHSIRGRVGRGGRRKFCNTAPALQ